jgi:hypothetical protein
VPLRVVNVTWIDLRALAYIRHFWSQIWIARRWVLEFLGGYGRITVRG